MVILLLKRKKCSTDKGILGHGDVYTWTAIDADTKLAISWLVGRRDYEYAEDLLVIWQAV